MDRSAAEYAAAGSPKGGSKPNGKITFPTGAQLAAKIVRGGVNLWQIFGRTVPTLLGVHPRQGALGDASNLILAAAA